MDSPFSAWTAITTSTNKKNSRSAILCAAPDDDLGQTEETGVRKCKNIMVKHDPVYSEYSFEQCIFIMCGTCRLTRKKIFCSSVSSSQSKTSECEFQSFEGTLLITRHKKNWMSTTFTEVFYPWLSTLQRQCWPRAQACVYEKESSGWREVQETRNCVVLQFRSRHRRQRLLASSYAVVVLESRFCPWS